MEEWKELPACGLPHLLRPLKGAQVGLILNSFSQFDAALPSVILAC
jgi:hypothetical protein